VLLALQMFSVRMQNVVVFNFQGEALASAHDFVSGRLSWDQFQAAGLDYRLKRAVAAPSRPAPPTPVGPPRPPRPGGVVPGGADTYN
jgi:hypothetical protein